jgi:hypothetical protein
MLLHSAWMIGHDGELERRIHKVARQLAPYARSERLRLSLALNPALALDFALAHIVLTRLGYRDAGFEAQLRAAWDAQGRGSRERVPHRVMEQQWIEWLWRGDKRVARELRRSARLSIVGQPLDVLNAGDDELYAWTHAVMYAARFERNKAALPRPRRVVLAEAEVALARSLDAEDYDLAGELLMAWPLTGGRWSPVAAFAFRVLAEVEDRAGFLPTPGTRLVEMKAREGVERRRYFLSTAYHTAFVMGFLCAAALAPECAPPWKIVRSSRRIVGDGVRGAAKALMPWLEDGGAMRHWQEVFAELEDAERDALAPMLFAMAMQRKTQERDFGTVARLLGVGQEMGLANGPVASQAAELLERVCVYAAAAEQERMAVGA